jgi:hypothetical protein
MERGAGVTSRLGIFLCGQFLWHVQQANVDLVERHAHCAVVLALDESEEDQPVSTSVCTLE